MMKFPLSHSLNSSLKEAFKIEDVITFINISRNEASALKECDCEFEENEEFCIFRLISSDFDIEWIMNQDHISCSIFGHKEGTTSDFSSTDFAILSAIRKLFDQVINGMNEELFNAPVIGTA